MMKKKHLFLRIFFPIFIFLTLCYLFFPYGLLKNYLLTVLQSELKKQNIPLVIELQSLKPYWFTGVELKGLTVTSPLSVKRKPFFVETMNARLSVLPLFIGKIFLSTSIDQPNGDINSSLSISILDLIRQDFSTGSLKMNAKNFDFGGLIDQYLNTIGANQGPEFVFVLPIIAKTSVGGYLNGHINFVSDSMQKNAQVQLNFDKLFIKINDSSLNIPEQKFVQSKVELTWNGNIITIGDSTAFMSQDMKFKLKGNVKPTTTSKGSTYDLNLFLSLSLGGQIDKNFGFVVPQVLKCPANTFVAGNMNIKINGPLDNFKCL